MLFFERRELEGLVIQWCNERGIPVNSLNIITALNALGYLSAQSEQPCTCKPVPNSKNLIWDKNCPQHKHIQSEQTEPEDAKTAQLVQNIMDITPSRTHA